MTLLSLHRLREPRANQISTSIFFHSPKIGRQIWCESNLEWDTAILLDHAPSVIEYCEQAIELHWSKSSWIPDFVALLKKGEEFHALIIEVKYLQDLLQEKDHFEQKYLETEEWISHNFSRLSSQISKLPITKIDFLVVTDQTLHQSFRVRNCRKLIQAVIEDDIDYLVHNKVQSILKGNKSITLNSLGKSVTALSKIEDFPSERIFPTIFSMIYFSEIKVDIEKMLTPTSYVYAKPLSFIPVDDWLKQFNWAAQTHCLLPIIDHEDLYFVANTPEKSIQAWKTASERLDIILPLLDCSIKEIKSREIIYEGKTIPWSTAYRWILKYKDVKGDIRSLLPQSHLAGRKMKTEHPIADNLWQFGKNQYLQRERKSIQHAYDMMKAYSSAQKQIKHCMSYPTFHRRIQALEPKEVAQHRSGKRNAEKDYELTESEFPHGDFPLQSVQIDHTPLDVLVVDAEHRQVTERPYLTIAFDSHTRCVLGYHITYNKPSRLSIALTLLNCIQEKMDSIDKISQQFPSLDEDTKQLIQASDWTQVYGLPYTLHMDNGSDFRSNDIELFGARYKMHLHYRAVKKPQHGAYVERVLGTLNQRLHSIAGTTFSNSAVKRDYPSEKKAIYTIEEIEARVLIEILRYHEDYHNGIQMPPIKKWNQAFAFKDREGAISKNLGQIDPNLFHLDILPSENRSVQKHGVQLFNLQYADPRIQQYVGKRSGSNRKNPQSFLIRYDPRDIREVYFFDPNLNGYIELKCHDRFVQTYYRDQSLSLWHWQTIKRDLRHQNKGSPSHRQKYHAYMRAQQSMDLEAASRTKSVRIRRARELGNQATRAEYPQSLPDFAFDEDPLSDLDPSLFKISIDESEIEYIEIPPDEENPFFGITMDAPKEQIQEVKEKHG